MLTTCAQSGIPRETTSGKARACSLSLALAAPRKVLSLSRDFAFQSPVGSPYGDSRSVAWRRHRFEDLRIIVPRTVDSWTDRPRLHPVGRKWHEDLFSSFSGLALDPWNPELLTHAFRSSIRARGMSIFSGAAASPAAEPASSRFTNSAARGSFPPPSRSAAKKTFVHMLNLGR